MRLAMALFVSGLLALAGYRVLTAPVSYATQDRLNISAPASAVHPAGTDELGRDRAVRLCCALLICLGGACAASLISSTLSVSAGLLAAFGPRWLGASLLYLGDLCLTLPWLFLLMLVRAALPLNLPAMRSGAVTFLLLALLGAPSFFRLHHERTASLARAEWLLQARASGFRTRQVLAWLLPHIRPLFLLQCLLYIPACLIAEANLGTLGLGLGEPLPSLGTFLAGLQNAALLDTSRLVYLPVAILVLVLVALELSLFGVHE